MRLIAPLGLLLALSGCGTIADSPFEGFGGFLADTHTPVRGPNGPVGDSDNMRRVRGEATTSEPLEPEPGNVWPGPLPPEMTLGDIQRANDAETLRPGEELRYGSPRGSSAPPGLQQASPQGLSQGQMPAQPVQNGQRIQPSPSNTPIAQPAPRDPTISTPSGPAVLRNGGGSNVQTYTDPRGNTGVVIPNGNGTSTLVAPDGSVQTVPSPR